MNIRKKFFVTLIAYFLLIFTAILILSSLITELNEEANEEIRVNELADRIATQIFDLSIITNDYLLHGNARSEEQWYKQYEKAKSLLVSADFKTFENRRIASEIESELSLVYGNFERISQEDLEPQAKDRLAASLLIRLQDMLDFSKELNANTRLGLIDIQSKTLPFILFFFILIFLSSTYLFYIVSSGITEGVRKLTEGARELEKGNYTVSVKIKSSDEFEELGKTFNKVTSALMDSQREHKELDNAKTRFLSITSHELRSPMTPIKAQLQMLSKGFYGKISKKQEEAIDMILRNAKRLDNIIVDFLDISRIEAARLRFNIKKTTLEKELKDLLTSMDLVAKNKGVKLKFTAPSLGAFQTDPDRVSQVLRNLIDNAIKFTDKGGTVEVSSKETKSDITFSVTDTGPGIEEMNQEKVFEPFFQAERTIYRKAGGSGLGLAICRGIVLSQGGRIWLESKVGKGSTFSFTLPKKPLKNPKPIRLLFSKQDNLSKRIVWLFSQYGKLSAKEFKEVNLLKEKKQAEAYVKKFVSDKRLSPEKAQELQINLGLVFSSNFSKKKKI